MTSLQPYCTREHLEPLTRCHGHVDILSPNLLEARALLGDEADHVGMDELASMLFRTTKIPIVALRCGSNGSRIAYMQRYMTCMSGQ